MSSGSTPLATWFNGPVFSRARDIFAANMTELLDRAEDPGRMIRMIILEMEETLVELRASAARSIADMKEMRRAAEASVRADLFVSIGSSLVVEPAASFPRIAKQSGARLVILNHQETPLDGLADLVIREGIGATMRALLQRL